MLLIECPHCQCMVYIESINCAIFRHAVYKHNQQPIPPHSSKEVCDRLIEQNSVYGCAGPFKLVANGTGAYNAIICDYI